MADRRLLVLAAGAAIAAAAGWIAAGPQPAGADIVRGGWREPPSVDAAGASALASAEALKASGVLTVSPRRAAEIEAQAQEDPAEREDQPFSAVLAASVIDGEPTVSLRLTDGAIATVREGDMVGEGWRVTQVGFDAVLAEKDGEVFSAPVFARRSGNEG